MWKDLTGNYSEKAVKNTLQYFTFSYTIKKRITLNNPKHCSMSLKKQGLQKFTNKEIKINKILSLKEIKPEDINDLSVDERNYFMEVITEKYNNLTGNDKDDFYTKIASITSNATKNQIWENNHNQITWAISSLMQDYGRMPNKSEIATKTGLSRTTIHKHLEDYSNHAQFLVQKEQFRFMSSKVLAKVFQFAVNGDIGAAKLYFNVVGNLSDTVNPANTLIQNQNNYIQVNKTVLSQESLKNLKPHQLDTIENILKSTLTQAELDYSGLSDQTLKEISELKPGKS